LEAWEIVAFTQGVAATLVWNVLPVSMLAGLFATRLARGRVATLAVRLASGVPTGGLAALLAETLRDPSVELAFPAPDGNGLVDTDGRPVVAPSPDDPTRAVTRLERDGRLLALLVHDPAIDEGDPDLVPAVGSVAQMALVNERLSAQVKAQLEEVRASRSRIVEATDAERRRVERELHDGAQQRLVALSMKLEAARAGVVGASTLIDQTTAELGVAIDEVRQLARGLHPTILTESGLRAAVDALAERTPIPVTVDVPEGRFPGVAEATAYYVIAEAITNVAKYAAASGITVRVRQEDGRLRVTIEDDGRGGADPASGSGLRGLFDRVAAAGGSLRVESPPGAGTRILAEVPVG
jgi:signal transduction histidine kinase